MTQVPQVQTTPQGINGISRARRLAEEGFSPLLSMRLGAEAALLSGVEEHSLSEAMAERGQAGSAPSQAQGGEASAQSVRERGAEQRGEHPRSQSRGEELRHQRFEREGEPAPEPRGRSAGPGGDDGPVRDAPETSRKAQPAPSEERTGPRSSAPPVAAGAAPSASAAPRTGDGAQPRAVEGVAVKAGGGERSASAIRVVGESQPGAGAREALDRARAKTEARDQAGLRKQSFQAQVGRGLAAALKQKGGVVTLRLKPESMGQLRIRLELSGGRVRASFQADQSSARELLSGSLDALRSTLEARGLTVERLQVENPAEEMRQDGAREGESRPRGDEGHAGRGGDPEDRPRSGRWSGGSGATVTAEPPSRTTGSEAGIAEGQGEAMREEAWLDLRVGLDAIA